ncbi:MAG: hypothetical protein NTZ18_04075 [Candidatus Komeilibacteria bacterium]|nr:hypothetical protein [Candidatus Komeilibacteria bacterium]
MSETLEKLFSLINSAEPPSGLLEKILARLAKERQLSLRKRLVVFSAFTALSAVAIFLSIKTAQTRAGESGFWQFFSLLFSDFATIKIYWQNFALSLLETLPVTSLIMVLAAILIFLESLKSLFKNIKLALIQYNH